MQPKRGKGRPKLPAESLRKFSVHVTVNTEERRQIRAAAQEADLSVSAWARAQLQEALKRHRRSH